MAGTRATAADGSDRRGPIRRVLGLEGYRRYWFGQLLVSIVSGTIRFAFVWLVLDLTGWSPAVGIMGLALGLPITFLSLPAGVVSDRYDRRALVGRFVLVGAVVLGLTAALVATDVMTVPLALGLAVVAGAALAMVAPPLQAMVPSLVPAELLMTGVALQGIGQNTAQLSGVLLGGAAIDLLGTANAFALLGVLLVGAAAVMRRVPDVAAGPQRREGRVLSSIRTSVFDGVRYVSRREPLRSVVLVALVGGTCGGMNQLLLPGIARSEMGASAFRASLLFGGLGLGMIITTLGLARRPGLHHPGKMLALWFLATCGPGLLLMGATDRYWVAMSGMLVWGLGGGFVMTTQRTMLQRLTSDELMGRVISVHTLALTGSFPVAALLSFGFGTFASRRAILLGTGLTSFAIAAIIAWRSPLVRTVVSGRPASTGDARVDGAAPAVS